MIEITIKPNYLYLCCSKQNKTASSQEIIETLLSDKPQFNLPKIEEDMAYIKINNQTVGYLKQENGLYYIYSFKNKKLAVIKDFDLFNIKDRGAEYEQYELHALDENNNLAEEQIIGRLFSRWWFVSTNKGRELELTIEFFDCLNNSEE